MSDHPLPPYRETLTQLVHQAGYDRLIDLARAAEVSEWHLLRLEWGLLRNIPFGVMVKVAIALGQPLATLSEQLGSLASSSTSESAASQSDPQSVETDQDIAQRFNALQREYQHLQAQYHQLPGQLDAKFQQQALETLEPWLLQWPTAAAIAQKDPDFSAQKLMPLIRPVINLLSRWQVEANCTVGDTVAYDSQWQQWIGDEPVPAPKTPVVVRYVGYQQGETLLHRAKVSFPQPEASD